MTTTPEPEDATPRDTAGPEGPASGPGHRSGGGPRSAAEIDAAFAAIVADWAAADAPRWPEETRTEGTDLSSGVGLATPPGGSRRPADGGPRTPEGPRAPGTPRTPGAPDAPRGTGEQDDPRRSTAGPWRGPTGSSSADAEDESYEPPEPPPLPRLGVSSVLGLLLLVAGVVLLAVPGVVGDVLGLGVVPGLLAMTAGLGWLVFGLRRSSDRDGGPDEGGIV